MRPGDDIRAGDLREVISLYGPVYEGDEVTNEALLAAGVSASKRSLQGREVVESGRELGEAWAIFTIRWRSDVTVISRITHGGDKWDVQAVESNGRRRTDIRARQVR